MRLTDLPLRPLDRLREWVAVRLAPWAIFEDVLEHHGRGQRVVEYDAIAERLLREHSETLRRLGEE